MQGKMEGKRRRGRPATSKKQYSGPYIRVSVFLLLQIAAWSTTPDGKSDCISN